MLRIEVVIHLLRDKIIIKICACERSTKPLAEPSAAQKIMLLFFSSTAGTDLKAKYGTDFPSGSGEDTVLEMTHSSNAN